MPHQQPPWRALVLLALCLAAGCASPTGPTAVIADQLSDSHPNPDFVRQATEILTAAGYQVDYVPRPQVTVDFFRALPGRGYDIILLRAHSSATYITEEGQEFSDGSVTISTGEPLNRAHRQERNGNRVVGFLLQGEEEPILGVRWEFFAQDAEGRFEDSLIVLMGCDGLKVGQTARSLVELGAANIVGWNGKVSIEHTDQATLFLLLRRVHEGLPIVEAVELTRALIGPDPAFGSELMVTVWRP